MCPTINLINSRIKFSNFAAACLVTGPYPVVRSQFSKDPISISRSSSTSDTTFFYAGNSRCVVEARDDLYPPALCFVYKLSELGVVPAANFSGNRDQLLNSRQLLLAWNYSSNMAQEDTGGYQRRAQLIVLDNSQQGFVGIQGSGAIGTGSLLNEGMVTLIRKEKLKGKKVEYYADLSIRSIPTTLKDLYPARDFVALSFSLNPLGTQVISEQDPLNFTVLLSQFFSGWSFVMVLFGVLFTFDQTRYSVLHQLLAKRWERLAVVRARAPPKEATTHADLYPADL